jgi:hypothetical protein
MEDTSPEVIGALIDAFPIDSGTVPLNMRHWVAGANADIGSDTVLRTTWGDFVDVRLVMPQGEVRNYYSGGTYIGSEGPRVTQRYVVYAGAYALEKLTGLKLGRNRDAWLDWWHERNKGR